MDSLLGGLLPAPDPTYLLPFAGAFLVSTVTALVAARVGDAEFDLDRLSTEIGRLDEGSTDGRTGVGTDEAPGRPGVETNETPHGTDGEVGE
jgi:hypothetical protein